MALQQALNTEIKKINPQSIPSLSSIEEIRTFFNQAHTILRNNYFMQINFHNKQDFEWTPMRALVVNTSGLYRIESDRAVYKHSRYAAIGSGDAFAIGALEALYPENLKAEEIATKSLEACRQLDAAAGKEKITELIKITELTINKSKIKAPTSSVIKSIKKSK